MYSSDKNYCYRCGKWKILDKAFMCVNCAAAWLADFLEKR